jgi:hypothetical protein
MLGFVVDDGGGAPGRTLWGPEAPGRGGAACRRDAEGGPPGRGGSDGVRGGAGRDAFMRETLVAPGLIDGRGGTAPGRGGMTEFGRCVDGGAA